MYSPNIYSQPNKYSPSTCLSLKSKTNKSPYGYNLFTKHCLKPNFFLQFILKEQKKTAQKERQKKCAVSSWRPVKVWARGIRPFGLWAFVVGRAWPLAVILEPKAIGQPQ